MSQISTKPYLLRALYEWCTDCGQTPYIVVSVDELTRVPLEYVKNGEIVLNISFGATSGLKMDNDLISFNARFSGVSREISIPVGNVLGIYASETGQGMMFDLSQAQSGNDAYLEDESKSVLDVLNVSKSPSEDCPPDPKKGGRPSLKIVK